MGLVGTLYLLFDKSILSSAKGGMENLKILDGLSRGIVGVQIGLIVLAMIVTRSSAISIQSKRGLPFGNQVIGWTVLSMQQQNLSSLKQVLKIVNSRIPCCAISPQPSTE